MARAATNIRVSSAGVVRTLARVSDVAYRKAVDTAAGDFRRAPTSLSRERALGGVAALRHAAQRVSSARAALYSTPTAAALLTAYLKLAVAVLARPSSTRYLAHAVVVGLVLSVAVGANFGSAADWRPLALDQAAELPSAFAYTGDRVAGDSIVKPPAPVTQLVNRPRQGIVTYKVREGDTVSAIAERYEVSVQTILWANGLAEDDILETGRPLVLLPVSGVLHTVQMGETVTDIARRYQSDAQAIVDFNQLTDPTLVQANDLLIVPGGRVEMRPRPVPVTRSDVRPSDDRPVGEAIADQASAASAQEQQALQPSTYVVAVGDTLGGIAAKFGVSLETLAWANSLQKNPEQLREGQKLNILPVSGAMHTVAEGDTMLEIAARYSVAADDIVAANRLASPDKLALGQQLMVPGAKLASATELAAQARAAAAAQAQAAAVKYTVRPGDSLLDIAARFGVESASIARANGMASPDRLSVGQVLAIPGGRALPAAPPSEAPRAAAPAPAPAPAPAKASAPPVQPAPAAPAAAAPTLPTSGDGSKIVQVASKYLGARYTWGGSSPAAGFDCSGLVWYVYQQAGVRVPRDLWGQLQAGPRVSRDQLLPGDIVFFQNTYQPGLSHNGIYIGGGRFINAQDYDSGVRVASLGEAYWGSRYFGASRPW